MGVAGEAKGPRAERAVDGQSPWDFAEVVVASRVKGGGMGSAGCGSLGDALCTGPTIGVQQLGLQRRQQLNSL